MLAQVKTSARVALWHTVGAVERRRMPAPAQLSSLETARRVRDGASLARFGDGEMLLMRGHGIGFQHADPRLAARLEEILLSRNDDLLVCLPGVLGELDDFTPAARRAWREIIATNRRHWISRVDPARTYGESLVTRFYLERRDREPHLAAVRILVETWTGRDVVIVEGAGTRFGVGNDLLDHARSVRRIECPSRHAFDRYDEILEAAARQPVGTLFLVSLGPTATVLAADLSARGYQALDTGHLDVEWHWMQEGATTKQAVAGKDVHEAGAWSGDAAGSLAVPAEQVLVDLSR